MKKLHLNLVVFCCREMSFEVDDNNIITDIDFIGGCPGNL